MHELVYLGCSLLIGFVPVWAVSRRWIGPVLAQMMIMTVLVVLWLPAQKGFSLDAFIHAALILAGINLAEIVSGGRR